MTKRLTTLYIALHLAFGPVFSAFASTCSAMPDQPNPHQECTHHQATALQQQDQNHQAHQNCHESDQDNNAHDRCGCHCPASTAGLVNTFFPDLADNVTVPFSSPVQTQRSVTDTPLFKPPRA